MPNDDVLIRPGMADDIPALTAIFNYYIEHSHARFTTEPMTLDSCRTWFGGYGAGRYRLLVAQDASGLLGAAYSSRYRPSSAFDTTVETSIYMDPSRRRGGIGTRLYGALLALLEQEDVHLAVAGVAQPNEASNALHRRLGFGEVGTFKDYARKRGAWISSTWFQRRIGCDA
ncbi:N-acetyltransferase family protein [Bosea sp. (in: a-proteobacteria)]|jgi:phosphinothricin acetyltransferase|uniref:GNAT family N-acetyltransferase n=1 Tax=Bosea sp. (in: a-proteobacteria) TaxID=1871050 RepID=UPI003569083B